MVSIENDKIEESRKLNKNKINNFILNFQLPPNLFDPVKVINNITPVFERREKRIIPNFTVNVKNNEDPVITKNDTIDHILINESKNFTITFKSDGSSFWFETSTYVDYRTYLDPLATVVEAIEKINSSIFSTRIGMRFVNTFPSLKLKDTSKVFQGDVAKNIIRGSSKEGISRFIAQEEYNLLNLFLRVQYGIPNKHFPAILNNYDLLLDIDAFDIAQQKISEWDDVLKRLNHAAYHKFIEYLNPKYLETLK